MSSRTILQATKSSPVVQEASAIVSNYTDTRLRFTWGILLLSFSICCFLESRLHWLVPVEILESYTFLQSLITYFGLVALIFSMIDFTKVVKKSFKQPHIMMSPIQRKLMGLKANDQAYQQHFSACKNQLNSSTSNMMNNFGLADLKHVKNTLCNKSHHEEKSPLKYLSPSSNSSFHTSATSPSPNLSNFNSSVMNHSKFLRTSPINGSFDGSFLNSSSGSPFVRHRKSYTNSPLPPEDCMTETGKLESYLENYEKEHSKLNAYEKSHNMAWNVNLHDYSNDLAENIYQLSTLSPKSPMRTKENKDDSARQAVEEYWKQCDVTHDDLKSYIASLREYISTVVLRSFVSEITNINKTLKDIGCVDVKVGKTSLSTLKLVQTKYLQRVPALTWMLFYLEMSTNQEYLVERVKTLATGYMSAFKWNKETNSKTRDTEEDLPNDCDLVMHTLCIFIDLHIPLNPRYPNGKSFSSCYYKDASKEQKTFDSNLYIQRSKLNPPHYQVIYKSKLYDPPAGRHNFFHALVLFLHIVKTEYDSMLGPVSLGWRGLNMLHIFDS